MEKKINFFEKVPKAMENLIATEGYFAKHSTIDKKSVELIKIRASQLNGCAYCLNMHTIDALKIGESPQRIFLLNAWWETALFSDKEKVLLELTDRLTKIGDRGLSRELTDRVLEHYSEKEFAELVLMIAQINTWNRINISIHGDIDPSYK